MDMPGFLRELRRRHVFRVAAAYAVVGWLLIQITTQVFPAFHMPDWAARAVILLILAGFPIVVVLSWVFDVTPGGIRRTEAAHSHTARAPEHGRRVGRYFNAFIIAVLALTMAVLLWQQFLPRSASRPAGSPASPSMTAQATANAGSSLQPASATTAIPAKSIAVLPFQSLSADQANAYFADGIQNEILTGLTKISNLKVISHTSTRRYASQPGNLAEIALQLGVAHLLEGSVQKVGDRVRVNVQLVDAHNDNQLWAQTYDRTVDNVFAVESEIAQQIAAALQVKLSGGERAAMTARPTENPQAYELYLRAIAYEARHPQSSADVPRHAAALYAEATDLDPHFALAWARLAIVKSNMYLNYIDRTPAQLGEVKHAAETALRLQPDLGEAHLAFGYYRYRCLRDFDGALREFELARQRLPNDADVLSAIGYVERRQGNWRDSISHLEQAIDLDPREVGLFTELAINYSGLRDFAKARAALDRALKVEPKSSSLIAAKADAWLQQGDVDRAGELLAGVSLPPADGDAFRSELKWLWYRRDFKGATAALERALAAPPKELGLYRVYYLIALGGSQTRLGQAQAARASFERAVREISDWRQSGADDVHLAQVLAFAHAGLGDKSAALREARHAVSLAAGDALMKPNMQIPLAQIQAHFGEAEAALAALPQLLEIPDGVTLGDLRLNPLWDPLRRDPRFQALLNKGAVDARH